MTPGPGTWRQTIHHPYTPTARAGVKAAGTEDRGYPQERQRSLEHAAEVIAALDAGPEVIALTGQLTVSATYACFDGNYERAMNSMFGPKYAQLDQAAAQVVGKSKQLRARYCARELAQPDDSTGWDLLRQLAEAVRSTVPAAPATQARRDVEPPPRRGEVVRPAPRP